MCHDHEKESDVRNIDFKVHAYPSSNQGGLLQPPYGFSPVDLKR